LEAINRQRPGLYENPEEIVMVQSSKGRMGLLLALTGILAIVAPLKAADESSVSGEFTGNGKEAKLQYVSASKGEPFADKPTIVLVFSEKDHSKDKKAPIGALFGKYGSALIITISEDGKIVGCQVVHTEHKKSGFSAIGVMKMSDFKLEDGKIQGKLSTGGEDEFFGDKWKVDIKFQVKAPGA
jgi:hypothetical protein